MDEAVGRGSCRCGSVPHSVRGSRVTYITHLSKYQNIPRHGRQQLALITAICSAQFYVGDSVSLTAIDTDETSALQGSHALL